jgi:putative transcriptional regulator
MSPTSMTNQLKDYRRRRGDMTQQALAEATRVSRQSIISIESGKNRPSVELALKLARALDVRVEDLFQLADTEREDG